MGDYWKTLIFNMLLNVALLAGYIILFAFLVAFGWNIGVLWLMPNFPEMGYNNALGLSVVGAVIRLSFNYWINRILHVKRTSIALVQLQKELKMLEQEYAKGGERNED